MGLFQNFRKHVKENRPVPLVLTACTEGTVVPMEKIPDPAFGEGILGPCIAIEPPPDTGECRILSPANGVVTQCSETGHAIGLTCGDTEILLHAGIDTVQMAGQGFSPVVQVGETVQQGQVLLVMDAAEVRSAGYNAMVITVITETTGKITFTDQSSLQAGDILCTINIQ